MTSTSASPARSRVLHVAAVEFTATRLLAPQLRYLRERGFDIRLACAPDGPQFTDALNEFDPSPVRFPRGGDPRATLVAVRDLRRLVHQQRPAAVHFHSPAAAFPGRVSLATRPNGVRIIYTAHGFLHQWEDLTPRDRIVERLEWLLSMRTDLLLFQSREDFDQAKARRYAGRLRYLGNGIQDEWFNGPRELGRGAPRHIVYVGRLSRQKGVLELLAALRAVPGLRATLIGEALPTDRDDISAEARRFVRHHRMHNRVDFAGMLPQPRVRDLLADADGFVLPSWREGLPRSIIEAMAAALPVVTTDIRGCRELVTPNENGWLVRPRDTAGLEAALTDFAGMPADRLTIMGRRSFERAAAEYREARVFERLVDAYEELGLRGSL
jgi:glycosyltransferase involved in cell wall biosynthesis